MVARRLMHALRALGHDANMLVVHKGSDDPHVVVAAPAMRAKIPFLAEHLRLFAACGFSKKNIFKVSCATDGLPLYRHPLVREADAVILNWVNQGMLSIDGIRRIASMKKTIWTMHDMWNMTAVCHHAGKCTQFKSDALCGACPMLYLKPFGKHARCAKNALYDEVSIHFVAVSSWLAAMAGESTLLKGRSVTVIPNAFPVEEFYIEPKKSRGVVGVPEGKKLIVMGAARLDDPVKGLDFAIQILNKLHREDAVAVFYGEVKDRSAFDALKFPYIHLGTIAQETVRELYAQADVVISTSRYETLPGTIVEGMAAGCTPVTFDSGGQRDIVPDDSLGFLVEAYDTDAFSSAIDKALDSPVDKERLRSHIRNTFADEVVANRYLELIKV